MAYDESEIQPQPIGNSRHPLHISRKTWLVIAALLVITMFVWVYRRPYVEMPDLVGWLESYEQGQAQADQTGKPMLIDFTSRNCGACRWLDRHVFSKESVAAAIREGFVPVRITLSGSSNEDAEQAAQRYGIWGLPTLVIVDGAGNQIGRQEGAQSSEVMLDWLQQTRQSMARAGD